LVYKSRPSEILGTEIATSVTFDEEKTGFWIGKAAITEGKDKSYSAELSNQKFFDKYSIVLEPMDDGGLAYICYQEAPYEGIIIYSRNNE
jgi:hypothetical protein